MSRLYLCGRMSGMPDWGFPVFDQAKKELESLGHEVISPADLDREEGFDPLQLTLPGMDAPEPPSQPLRRDVAALVTCDGVVLLPGWEGSRGGAVERMVAEACGLDVYEYDETSQNPLRPVKEKQDSGIYASVAREAASLVLDGPRGKTYGHPIEDFTRTAEAFNAMKGTALNAEDVALFLICVKLSRLQATPGHHDSIVDICGYAETWSMIDHKRKEIDAFNKKFFDTP